MVKEQDCIETDLRNMCSYSPSLSFCVICTFITIVQLPGSTLRLMNLDLSTSILNAYLPIYYSYSLQMMKIE